MVLCRVLPPRGLYHPVLPYRTGGKLLLPLCRTCAEERPTDPYYRCCHSDAQRRFTGTWVTCKLNKALDCGYKLDKVYEVWHFPQQSTDLFRRYIDIFLKIKQEASGFTPECETEEREISLSILFWCLSHQRTERHARNKQITLGCITPPSCLPIFQTQCLLMTGRKAKGINRKWKEDIVSSDHGP